MCIYLLDHIYGSKQEAVAHQQKSNKPSKHNNPFLEKLVYHTILNTFIWQGETSLNVFFRTDIDVDIERVKKAHKGLMKWVMIFGKMFRKETLKIIGDLEEKQVRKALFAYLLWSISIYSILISQIDFQRDSGSSNHIAMLMMTGYIVGVIILRMRRTSKLSDSTIVKWGYYSSFFSLIPYFLILPFFGDVTTVLAICYFIHSLGNAFLSPALLSVLSKEKPHHELGKVLGLVESFDTIAFMISVVFVMIYNYFSLPLYILVMFSFLTFSLSWVYYSRFKEPRVVQ